MKFPRWVVKKELKREKDRDRLDAFVDSKVADSLQLLKWERALKGYKPITGAMPDVAAEVKDRAEEVLRGWKPYKEVNTVTVRWHDGHMETFRATEVRFGSDLLWMRLEDGNNRHIPLRSVRWFGTSIESHQSTGF